MITQDKPNEQVNSLIVNNSNSVNFSQNWKVIGFVKNILNKQKIDFSLFFKKAYNNYGKSLDKEIPIYQQVDNDKINQGSTDYFDLSSSTKNFMPKNTRKNSLFDFNFFNKISRPLRNSLYLLAFSLVFVIFSFVTVFAYNNVQSVDLQPTKAQVKGVSENTNEVPELNIEADKKIADNGSAAYQEWITEKTGQLELPQDDYDGDDLTNMEEFLISTDPANISTCGGEQTDSQKLVELIDPVTCKEINVDDENSIKKYSDVVDLKRIKNTFLQDLTKDEPALQTAPAPDISDGSLISIFGASSLEDLNNREIDTTNIDKQIEALQKQAEYIGLIEKVDKYIAQSRSFEPYDRDYETPVSGAVYVDVSIRYDTPLKYVLAVAQRESRFGTDRYTANGNLTRPGEYKNIFSMGLDDSGNNIGFETWEKGVESFGKWYRRFDDAGVSDCRKWRIYNPNGDYCAHVEETASQIEFFLR